MNLDKISFWVGLAACVSVCVARSSGPDTSTTSNQDNVCNALRPNPDPASSPHGAGTAGDGDYRLDIYPPMTEATDGFSYSAHNIYTIRLVGTTAAATIRGFLVQARVPGDTPTLGQAPMLLGSFQPATGQQTYDCDGAGVANQATVTHSENQDGVSSVQLTWMSPSTAGVVDFYYTVMRTTNTHYDAIRARTVGLLSLAETTVAPQRSPDEYRLRVLRPDGCSHSTCDLFIGIDTNTGDSGFLDIHMEGNASGWIAVGFSDSAYNSTVDVVACYRTGGNITAIDAFNPRGRASIRDGINDVILYSASFVNGRISCTVSKHIAPSETQADLDLSRYYYVIWGRHILESPNDDFLTPGNTEGVSERRYKVTTESGIISRTMSVFEAVHRPNLIRAHGILMIIAWPLLAITGMFFAFFMRPALPNGEWFKVYRALMLVSLFIAAVAFVLIFVAHSNTNGLGTDRGHMVIGIVLMALHIVNPIVASFICNSNHKQRWIFIMVHTAIVSCVPGLAFANVTIGLSIFSRSLSQTFGGSLAPFWVAVAYDVFYTLVIIAGLVGFSVYARVTKQPCCAPSKACTMTGKQKEVVEMGFGEKVQPEELETPDRKPPTKQPCCAQSMACSMTKKQKDSKVVEMDSLGEKLQPEEVKTPDHMPPSKDAPLRWGFLAFYLVVTVPIFIAVIVMVALR